MSVITVKADVEKGVVYLSGWKESNVAKAFEKKAKQYFYVPFENSRVELAEEDASNQYGYICDIKTVAEWLHVDVDKSVDELFEKFKREYNEKRELRIAELIEAERQKEEKADCSYCRHCICVGDGDYTCTYSGDDLNSKIADDYDPVNGVHYCFADVPVRTSKCKYLTDKYLTKTVQASREYPDEWGR